MRKDDVVTITDSSYTRSVVNGELIHEWLAYGTEWDKQYIVVEIGCSFPLERRQPETHRNDTVIQALDGGKVVFIHNCFLRVVQKPVREVTMAEVCKQFGIDVKIKKD